MQVSDEDLVEMINVLYSLPECSAGGPLHIVTDDGNLENGHLDFCGQNLEEFINTKNSYIGRPEASSELECLAVMILNRFYERSLEERQEVYDRFWEN